MFFTIGSDVNQVRSKSELGLVRKMRKSCNNSNENHKKIDKPNLYS